MVVPWRSRLWARVRVCAHQLVHPGVAGGAHGGEDAAAGRQDLQVGFALQAHLELGRPVACPDQVGVRIDKAGQHQHAAGIQARLVRVAPQQVFAGAKGFNQAVAHQHRTIWHQAERPQGRAALRSARQGQQLRGRMDQHGSPQMTRMREL